MTEVATDIDLFTQTMGQHSLWLETGGAQGKRALLREMNFSGIDIASMGVSLAGADCTEANFSGANLSGVDCSGVNMHLANLNGANLSKANCSEANFVSATLTYAKFNEALLHGAALRNVVAHEADFAHAKLQNADLREGDFTHVRLDHADITGAHCRSAILTGVLLRHVNVDTAHDIDLRYVAESLNIERTELEALRVAFEKKQNETGESAKMREAGLNRREEEINTARTRVEAKQMLEEKVAKRLFEYSAICKYLAVSWFIISAALGTLIVYLKLQGRLPISEFEVALTILGAVLILGMHLFAAISSFKEYQGMMKTLNARID